MVSRAAARSFVQEKQNVLTALGVFVALFLVGAVDIDGFTAGTTIKSMLVLGSFLGIASIGQTLTALVGGIDLSIPFVIGMTNLALAWLLGNQWNSAAAIVALLTVGAGIGLVNGFLTWWLRLHPLLITLGVGFIVVGVGSIVTRGNVEGGAPDWLTKLTAVNSDTFGVGMAPIVFIWLVAAVAVLILMRLTRFGRNAYALGDNPVAAERALVDDFAVRLGVFALSGVAASFAGVLLLGFTGGGYVSVGDPYLFSTIAAVVVGGTSLLGGVGGYGLTVLGVAALTVLTTVLSGYGMTPYAQQVVMGFVILAMVSLYAREAHPRAQV